MEQVELLQPEHASAPKGEVGGGGAPHPSEANNDGVVAHDAIMSRQARCRLAVCAVLAAAPDDEIAAEQTVRGPPAIADRASAVPPRASQRSDQVADAGSPIQDEQLGIEAVVMHLSPPSKHLTYFHVKSLNLERPLWYLEGILTSRGLRWRIPG